MFGTRVKETAIDEHGNARSRKDQIGLAGQSILDSVAESSSPEPAPKKHLKSGVRTLYRAHDFAALKWAERI